MKIKISKNYLKYIITYFAIAFSGIPFFDANRVARTVFLVFLAVLFFYNNKKINKELLIIIAITMFLILMQNYYYGGGKLFTTASIIGLMILIPYFAIKLIGPNFLKYYRDVLYFISVVSLIIWTADNLVPGFHTLIYNTAGQLMAFTPFTYQESIIIYNWEDMQFYGIYRHAGPFHEPGAFAVFLVPAIVAEIFVSGQFITRKNIIFIFNLFTTMSTAGFIGLSFLIAFYVFTSKRMTIVTKYFVFIVMVGVIVVLFTQLEFLGDKITSQFEEQSEAHLTSKTAGRFLGIRKTFIAISRYPIYGRGLFANSQVDKYAEDSARYGWLTWVSQIGVFAGVIFMVYFFIAIKNYSLVNLRSKTFGYFAYAAILLALSAQKHTNTIVFFMIFLTPIMFPLKLYWKEYLLINDEPSEKKDLSKMIEADSNNYPRLEIDESKKTG